MWLIFDPRVGHEQSGRRPAIVLSQRLFTEHTSLAIVCPVTSTPKGLPFEVLLKHAQTTGAILPIHVRSVDVVARKCQFIEKAPASIVKTTSAYLEAIMTGSGRSR